MKKIFNSLFVIIASMIAFAGCAKQEVEAPASETKTVQFFAESIETKTAFGTPDGKTYPTLWTANDEKVCVALNDMDEKDSDLEISPDFKTARFETKFADNGGTSYKFFALSPASAKNSMSSSVLSANIWNSQTPLANSVDERAQVLYAVSDAYSAFPASVNMVFKHFTAYGKLSFANVNLNGAKMTSVTIESSVNIAGRWNYNVNSGEYTENSGSAAITLNTTATENIWFACAPVDMDGQSLTFIINTDKGPLSKTVTLSGKKFEAGKIAKMVVDMSDAKFAEQVVFELVTDVNDLTVGSEIIIAASASDVAISTTQNNNNRAEAAITKSENKIVDPASGVQVITVKEGQTAGTFAFNVGNGYLYAASSSSNYLKTETNLSANSSWTVTIANTGVATIKATGSNTRNLLKYNSSSKLFSCYSSGQADVAIYKLQGSGTVLENYLNVSTGAIEVDSDETSASFTVSSDLQWTATSDDADVDVTVEGNTVNVSFAANKDKEVKTYTIVVSAAGVESKTVTVTQEAWVDTSDMKLTVAEFKALTGSESTMFELSGVVSEIYQAYSSQYGNISFYIEDSTGKVLIFRLSCNAEIGNALRIGDQITVQGKPTLYEGTIQMAQGGVCVSYVAAPYVDFVSNSASVDAVSTTYSLNVLSNTNWTASASTGVSLDKTSGNGNATVVMTFAANNTEEPVTHTVTFEYGDKTVNFTLNQKGVIVSGGENGPYNEMFSAYSDSSSSNSKSVTITGDACSWSGVGVTTAYWGNFTWGSYSSGVTFLKPGSADAVYLVSEELSGGISTLSIAAAANNTSAQIQVSVINVDNNNAETVLGVVKTTSKKAKFTGSWSVSGVTGKYKIKITNHSTAAYVNVTDIQWD